MTDTFQNDPPRRVDGRTREARAARSAAQPIEQAAARSPTDSPARELPRGAVLGRDGKVVQRTRKGRGGDEFDFDRSIVPDGWDYQWNVVAVLGNQDIAAAQFNGFMQDGWTPVPAERHPGLFTAASYKGPISRGGVMLMERPMELTRQAKAEDDLKARQLIADRNATHRLGNLKQSMPDGFAMEGKYRGTGGDIRISVDKAFDVPRPSHQLVIED